MRKETLKKHVKNPIENDELRSDLNAVLKRKKTKNKLKVRGAFKLGLKSTGRLNQISIQDSFIATKIRAEERKIEK